MKHSHKRHHLISSPPDDSTRQHTATAERGVRARGYLVDLLLGVCEQGGEVSQGVTVEHHLGLLVRARHNVPHGPQGCRLEGREGREEGSLGQKHTSGAIGGAGYPHWSALQGDK